MNEFECLEQRVSNLEKELEKLKRELSSRTDPRLFDPNSR